MREPNTARDLWVGLIKHRQIFLHNLLFRLSNAIDYPLVPPDTIQLNLLYRCNLHCQMCKMDTRDNSQELSLDVLKKLVDEARAMGIQEALILGGEPFLRKDLFDLIKHVNGRGMASVIVTNGTLFTDENLQKLRESRASHIVISLDASNDKVMSAIRGSGVFDRVVENVGRFRRCKENDKDFRTCLSNCVTIMDQNIEDLFDNVAFSKKIGFSDVVFQPAVSDNTDQIRGKSSCVTSIPPQRLDIMEDAIDRLIDFKKSSMDNYTYIVNSIRSLELIKKYFRGTIRRRERHCYAGYNRFQATQDRKVYFCVTLGALKESSFGDIGRENIRNIWYSPQAKRYRKAIRKSGCCCMQRCAYRQKFEFTESIFERIALFGKEFINIMPDV